MLHIFVKCLENKVSMQALVLYCYLWEEKSLLGLQLPKESCWQGIYSANSSILNRILVFNTLNANA